MNPDTGRVDGILIQIAGGEFVPDDEQFGNVTIISQSQYESDVGGIGTPLVSLNATLYEELWHACQTNEGWRLETNEQIESSRVNAAFLNNPPGLFFVPNDLRPRSE